MRLHDLNLISHNSWEQKIESYWGFGEDIALKKLNHFIKNGLLGYKIERDYPAKENTSKLSPNLHFGEISPYQIWDAVRNIDSMHFPKEDLDIIQKEWNAIFFPLQYGIGIMKFQLPRIFSPFKAMPVLIGHSGLSGSFSFYCPEKDVFLCGTINQIKKPSQSYKLMLKLLQNLE
jgi:hypothetical protein